MDTKETKSKIDDGTDKPAGTLALAVVQEMKDVDVFKKPFPVAGIKRKVEVLDEESYLEEIGRIIQRDFFPDLEKLRAQNDYLEAIENNDVHKLRAIYSKYSIGRRLPVNTCSSPATFETPVMKKIEASESSLLQENQSSTDGDDTESVKALEKDHSLDEFFRKHTSEDNQSFEDLITDDEIKRRAKYPWLYKEETTLALPSTTNPLAIKEKPANIETWGYKNRNYIMYVPDGVDLTKEEKLELINKKKEINHSGTRLAACPFNEEQNKEALHTIAHLQNRVLEGKIGVDGKELSLTDTPEVNGYSFVKTPSPMPGTNSYMFELDQNNLALEKHQRRAPTAGNSCSGTDLLICVARGVNDSPLMTWGQIEGTPFRLDGSDTPLRPGLPGPKFKIAEPPLREKLAHALAEKVVEKKRDKKQKALETAKKQLAMNSPSITSSPFDSFDAATPSASPRISSSCLKGRRISVDLSLHASPSPREALSGLRTPKFRTPQRDDDSFSFTPSSSPAPHMTDVQPESLTDNLLNLNNSKRPTAADFFL